MSTADVEALLHPRRDRDRELRWPRPREAHPRALAEVDAQVARQRRPEAIGRDPPDRLSLPLGLTPTRCQVVKAGRP